MNIAEIKEILPHRFPFLLVDRVTAWEEGKWIKGYKNLTANESFFQGHFPQEPVMPGVLIIEAMAQLGAVLMLKKLPPEKRIAYFASIDRARFKRKVVPGDRLDLEVEVVRDRGSFVMMEGKAFVDGQLCCQATLSSITDRS